MKVKLGEVADQIRGVTYKSQDVEETLNNNSITLLRANNISNNGIINYDDVIYIKKNKIDSVQLIKQNDILVCASSGSVHLVGKAAQIKEDKLLSFGAFCKVIRPKNIHAIYLGYFFQSPYYRKTISSLAQGANINNIRNDDIDNLMINIYDDVATQEIVSILDKVTSLINMRKGQLEKLDILVKSKFIEMFGDPVLNPKGWKKKKLGNYISLISGYAFTNNDYNNSGIPVIKIGNINSGYFEPKNLNYVQENVKLNKYIVYPYDIVISLTGTVGKNDYGNLCILPSIYDKYYLNQRNAKLELINHLDKYFLYHIFKFEHIKKSLTKISRGIRQANISNNDILNLQLPIPPLDLQNQFAEFVEQVEKNKENIKSSLNQLETLYSALMQEYFG